MKSLVSFFALAAGIAVSSFAAPAAEPSSAVAPTTTRGPTFQVAPIVMPRATQYDFTSQINGRHYRIMVATPFHADPNQTYPVFYLFDGNWYFGAAADIATEAGNVTLAPAIIVGLGYPTDDNSEVAARRMYEMSLPTTAADKAKGRFGGGDEYLRILLEEVKPFVESHYHVDTTRQAIYGKSMGGLMVVRLLFQHPESFQTYIAANPALFWNDRAVLADEAAFSAKARAGEVHARVLFTSAANEQYHGPDSKRRAEDTARMVDNATELNARLARLNPPNLTSEQAIFPDEDHVSVSLASLGRGLLFGLKK